MNILSTFKELSKDDLFAVLKTLAYAFNKSWLKTEKLAIQKFGLNAFIGEEFIKVFHEFGAIQSKKLKELSILSGTDIDSIIKGFKLSQWALFENIDLRKLSDNTVKMRTINCTLQRYTKAKWQTDYPCKDFGFSLEARRGFVKEINPKAEIKCSFSPPDPRPKDIPESVSCEWIITIQETKDIA